MFGITTLDLVRAKTFIAEAKRLDPKSVDVDVIGGHSGVTIVPIFSKCKEAVLTTHEVDALTNRVQYGGDEVVKAKAGGGSATLSMAYAAAREFLAPFLRAINGGQNAVLTCFAAHSKWADADFFAGPVEFGAKGVERFHALPPLNSHERHLLNLALPELKKDIEKGLEFARK